MRLIEHDIRKLGEVAATHELYARGYTRTQLHEAVRCSAIMRVRKGWYSRPGLASELVQAWRVGGKLAGVSAARHYGLWVPGQSGPLEVQVPPSACQLRSREDYRRRLAESDRQVSIHWVPVDRSASRVLVSPVRCLERIVGTRPVEFAYVVAESSLNSGLITLEEWAVILDSSPRRVRRALKHAGSQSESGTESMFAFRMRKLGVKFRQQVRIGRDRVDFVIGEALVVEVDSNFHDRVADSIRDARLGVRGYRVLRFDYELIVHHWELVQAAVLAALSRGDHLAA